MFSIVWCGLRSFRLVLLASWWVGVCGVGICLLFAAGLSWLLLWLRVAAVVFGFAGVSLLLVFCLCILIVVSFC